jgi:hypothetical protein
MSQKSLLENQVVEEILRERIYYYLLNKKTIDFWLLISPNFIYKNNLNELIQNSNFYKNNKNSITYSDFPNQNNLEFYGALVTTDKEFYKWLKLRIGYYEEVKDLQLVKNRSYVSDGICGTLDYNGITQLSSNPKYLHPSISIDRYKEALELYLAKETVKLQK